MYLSCIYTIRIYIYIYTQYADIQYILSIHRREALYRGLMAKEYCSHSMLLLYRLKGASFFPSSACFFLSFRFSQLLGKPSIQAPQAFLPVSKAQNERQNGTTRHQPWPKQASRREERRYCLYRQMCVCVCACLFLIRSRKIAGLKLQHIQPSIAIATTDLLEGVGRKKEAQRLQIKKTKNEEKKNLLACLESRHFSLSFSSTVERMRRGQRPFPVLLACLPSFCFPDL